MIFHVHIEANLLVKRNTHTHTHAHALTHRVILYELLQVVAANDNDVTKGSSQNGSVGNKSSTTSVTANGDSGNVNNDSNG